VRFSIGRCDEGGITAALRGPGRQAS
jgi:hypothetical protein